MCSRGSLFATSACLIAGPAAAINEHVSRLPVCRRERRITPFGANCIQCILDQTVINDHSICQ